MWWWLFGGWPRSKSNAMPFTDPKILANGISTKMTTSNLFIIWQLIIPCGYFAGLWQCQINLFNYRLNKLTSHGCCWLLLLLWRIHTLESPVFCFLIFDAFPNVIYKSFFLSLSLSFDARLLVWATENVSNFWYAKLIDLILRRV